MNLPEIIKVDPDLCKNCFKCISVCPVKYCNIATGDYVEVDPDLCIGCGACLEACNHNARYFIDDFEQFLNDLNSKKMVAIVAPAIAANFPYNYLKLNGWLKSIGIEAVFDVSFGAELTVKSYIEYLKENHPDMIIAQPCPAIVTYIEIYKPELLKYLAPAHSPMLHTIQMIKNFYPQYKNHKIVVISPCIAKKREFDETGLGDYNVTFKKIEEYFKKNNINLNDFEEVDFDNEPAERAVLFSSPGGLLKTAEREYPEISNLTRKIEGPDIIYKYLETLEIAIKEKANPLLIDCLNCEAGCNGGTGTVKNPDITMDMLDQRVENRKKQLQKKYYYDVKNNKIDINKINETLNKYWKKEIYKR